MNDKSTARGGRHNETHEDLMEASEEMEDEDNMATAEEP
jgi:hypothetical protein